MNLRQLKYVQHVVANDMSVSKAARALGTSQPGISQQIRALEAELGVDIFVREKNRLTAITQYGRTIIERLDCALSDIDYICSVAKSKQSDTEHHLVVITSHTQARYVFPGILESFSRLHPDVQVDVIHGNPSDITRCLLARSASIGVIAGKPMRARQLVTFPCAEYNRVVVVPKEHPLLKLKRPTLKEIATYPLITYESSISARDVILNTFRRERLAPRVILSAIDADVIKACVERGLGISVLPDIAIDKQADANIRILPTERLFPPSTTTIAIHRQQHLRDYEFEFIGLLAPLWTRRRVEKILNASRAKRQALRNMEQVQQRYRSK